MSALGVVPGYAYPAFDYENAEFLNVAAPGATLGAPGILTVRAVTAAVGYALYIRDIYTVVAMSAAVSNRQITTTLINADGVAQAQNYSTLTIPAGTTAAFQWSVQYSTAYSAGVNGFTPLTDMVLPTGWAWQIDLFFAQAGDVISTVTSTGLRIPNVVDDRTPSVLTRPPLLT